MFDVKILNISLMKRTFRELKTSAPVFLVYVVFSKLERKSWGHSVTVVITLKSIAYDEYNNLNAWWLTANSLLHVPFYGEAILISTTPFLKLTK